MYDDNARPIKDKVKEWLLQTGTFRILTVEDPQFHFCFGLIYLEDVLVPINVGHLKELVEGVDCMIVGWEWMIDQNDKGVREVMKDSILKTEFIKELEEQVDPNYFKYIFNPNPINFYSIKAQRVFPLSSLTKSLLDTEIQNVMILYGKMKYVFELVAGI